MSVGSARGPLTNADLYVKIGIYADHGRLDIMKIEVFGTGCPKCRKAEEIIRRVLAKVGVEAEIAHVDDLNEIVSRGILATPAVMVDGVKKAEGKVPSEGEIRRWVGK